MAEISIIIPVYNAGNKLKKCLHSILKQTYQDYEVILVNDGSTDRSGQICDRFSRQDSRFIVIHQDNQGSVAARKHGLDAAKGQFTCFCDADDRMPGTALEVLHSHIGDADICIGDSIRLWRNIRINCSNASPCFQIEKPILYDSKQFRDKMLCSWFGISNVPVGLWGKLFNTDILKEAYQNIHTVVHFFGDDLIITLNAVTQASKICIIPNCVYEYRVGGGTTKYNPYMLDGKFSRQENIKEIIILILN